MGLAKLLLRGSPTAGDQPNVGPPREWPHANPMLLGIPQAEFTASVRRAIWALLGEARSLRGELEQTRTLLRKAEQDVDRDHLLPVLNRRAFLRELDRQIDSATRYATPTSLAYIDLDGLKTVNDAQGHACGDALLVHFSSVLLSVLRSSDVVGRLGGDEFGLILLHTTEIQGRTTCSRIAGALEGRPLNWRDLTIPIRSTIGLVQIAAGTNAETALAAADAAMYREKAFRR